MELISASTESVFGSRIISPRLVGRPSSQRPGFAFLLAVWTIVSLGLAIGASAAAVHGLPFTRSYSLEDIGNVPRGARLDFDTFGRVAVIHEGIYMVLNDTVWLNLTNGEGDIDVAMGFVVQGRDGRTYYGARGSWGFADFGPDGRLRANSLVPVNPPAWTRSASFDDLIVTDDGIYFASRSGVVYRDFKGGGSQLYELSKISKVFRVGNRVYVSSFEQPLRLIDVDRRVVETAAGTELDVNAVEHATTLDETRSLISFLDGRLAVFDGKSVQPWPGQSNNGLFGRISVIRHLVDGGVAIGILGKGLFFLSPDGELKLGLTTAEYHRVLDVANREPGVLWVATEDALIKVLYNGPLTTFGQKLGLPLSWPLVASWEGRIFVASDGKLYETVVAAPGAISRFVLMEGLPPGGVWALAASGPRMLAGSGTGIFSVDASGGFFPVGQVADLVHLVMVDAEHCYAIGRSEIALLEWRNDRWSESVPRIPGLKNPAVVHRAGKAVWIEMGGDGVARLSFHGGRLALQVVANASWTKSKWVNIGTVGDTVVLSGSRGELRFFDEKTGDWCEAPQLARLLARAPRWIERTQRDDQGTIWATHNEGVVKFTPKGEDYEMDASSFDQINDRFPVVHVFPGSDVWLSAGRSLYHVEPARELNPKPLLQPKLVSIVDLRSNLELVASHPTMPTALKLPFGQNSLAFRFFYGGYTWRRSPVYEYRLAEHDPWTQLDAGLPLNFRELHEGQYRLQVRVAEGQGIAAGAATFAFEILPPWYRTRLAYLLFGLGIVLALVGLVRWSAHLAYRRNRVLERIVHERTSQLEATMGKLNDETRNAATLAERNRLAGEIHDSIQQGLVGAILQLDTTLKLPAIAADLRARLDVVRNMISYTRQEVQHAVWDMESPLLEGTELGDALQKQTAFINPGEAAIATSVSGAPVPLPRNIKHNLLRIAQEAMTNAVRHASARKIAIGLEYAPESVALVISDDGIGFSPDEVLRNMVGHFGLRGIRVRARKLRGKLAIQSSPNQGTSIRVVVPLAPPQPST